MSCLVLVGYHLIMCLQTVHMYKQDLASNNQLTNQPINHYIYIYVCVCACKNIFMYTFVYIYIHIYMYTHTYAYA